MFPSVVATMCFVQMQQLRCCSIFIGPARQTGAVICNNKKLYNEAIGSRVVSVTAVMSYCNASFVDISSMERRLYTNERLPDSCAMVAVS